MEAAILYLYSRALFDLERQSQILYCQGLGCWLKAVGELALTLAAYCLRLSLVGEC